ncbi:hypothetical protein PMAYCL1PPCAC_01159, partial [Pristionchus mayeri]
IVCSECGKNLGNKRSLKSHMLIHSGEKPYSCPVCRKSFRTSSARSFHTRTVHKKVKSDDSHRKI